MQYHSGIKRSALEDLRQLRSMTLYLFARSPGWYDYRRDERSTDIPYLSFLSPPLANASAEFTALSGGCRLSDNLLMLNPGACLHWNRSLRGQRSVFLWVTQTRSVCVTHRSFSGGGKQYLTMRASDSLKKPLRLCRLFGNCRGCREGLHGNPSLQPRQNPETRYVVTRISTKFRVQFC